MLKSLTPTAGRINSALSHRSWAINGAAECHLFLLVSGHAALARPGHAEVEITAPAMLWLPEAARGTVRILAGGEGFAATFGGPFLQRAVGDPALSVHLRPLLDRVALAGPDMLAGRLRALAVSFAALVEEAQGTRAAADAMAGLHLATMLMELWRCSGAARPAGGHGAGATTAQRFRRLVELHYREGLRIDEFASLLGVTRAHLHDACLRAAGRTPLALLHERLLAEARTRLEQTDLSVEQVGYGIGFRDPGYFNRFFKRLTGQSPGAYRRAAASGRAEAAAPSFAAWP